MITNDLADGKLFVQISSETVNSIWTASMTLHAFFLSVCVRVCMHAHVCVNEGARERERESHTV